MTVVSGTKIVSISSPTHSLEISIDEPDVNKGLFRGTATFATKTTNMDRDIVVVIANEDPTKQKVFVEKSQDYPNSDAAMISFIPRFEAREQKGDFIFLVDRSASMGSGFGTDDADQKMSEFDSRFVLSLLHD